MARFDAPRATRQMFVDALARAFSSPDGLGWGYHFVALGEAENDPDTTVMIFETPNPLKGWGAAENDYVEGPHRVMVTVAAATELSPAQQVLRRYAAGGRGPGLA